MDDDLFDAVLAEARRRRRAHTEPTDLLGALAVAAAARTAPAAQANVVVGDPDDGLMPPLLGARHRRSTPDQIAAFFGRVPASMPRR